MSPGRVGRGMASTPTACDCPLCPHECDGRNHLRDHLRKRHRKSEVIDAYLDCAGL